MKHLIFATIAGCLAILTYAAEARPLYDGSWDLLFVTQRGACNSNYNFSVDINNEIVTPPNLIRFRGYVARSGTITCPAARNFPYEMVAETTTGTSLA